MHTYFFSLLLWLAVATAAASRKPLIRAPRDARITGDHMVVLDENVSHEQFQQLLVRISKVSEGAAVRSYVENVAKVITATLSPFALEKVRTQAEFTVLCKLLTLSAAGLTLCFLLRTILCSLQVRKFEGVSYIEEEDIVYGDQTLDLPWHVDRIDQTELPLDLSYQPIGNGDGVDVYILDSGINYDHQEFEYRAKYAGELNI